MKALVLTDAERRLLFDGALGPLLAKQLDLQTLADAAYQGLGAQTGGQVTTPPHRKFKKHPPPWWRRCSPSSARHTPRAATVSSTASPTSPVSGSTGRRPGISAGGDPGRSPTVRLAPTPLF